MPFLDPSQTRPTGLAQIRVAPDEPLSPTLGEMANAAMRENSLGSAMQYVMRGGLDQFEAEPGYTPYANDGIAGYEQFADRFIDARSPQETARIRSRIDRELEAQDVLARGGAAGFAMALAAGVVDPINFIPVGGQVYRGTRMGVTAARLAGSTALTGAASAAVAEAILQGTQETRSLGESAFNVAGSTVLSGMLGGAAGALIARSGRAEFDKIGNQIDGEVNGPERFVRVVREDSVGAARVEVVDIEGQRLADTVLGFSPQRMQEVVQDPVAQGLGSESVSMTQVTEQIAEVPYLQRKNQEGQATEPSVQRLVEMWNGNLAVATGEFSQIFVRYQTGQANVQASPQTRLSAAARSLVGSAPDGRLNYDEFNQAVARAMRNNDQSEIAEVAEAASMLRRNVFDPLKDEAISLGLLPPDVSPSTAASYFTRLYDTNLISRRRPEFVDITQGWLRGEQGRWQEGYNEANARLSQERTIESDLQTQMESVQSRLMQSDPVAFEQEVSRELNQLRREGPQTLLQFVRANGGLLPDADIRAILDRRATSVTRNNGRSLDEMTEAAWEAGFFPQFAERPSVREFLDAIGEDARSGRVVRSDDMNVFVRMDELEGQLEELRLMRETPEGVRAEADARALRVELERLRQLKDKSTARLRSLEDRLEDQRRFADLSDDELRDIAEQITDNVLGNSPGRTFYGAVPLKRGPIKERTFNIPDELIEGFLVNDINTVTRAYARTMASDIELTRKFGRADMEDQVQRIKDDYARLRDRARGDEKRLTQLAAREGRDLRNIAAMRDRIRGNYAVPANPDGLAYRAIRQMKNWNFVTSMGAVVLASIPDASKALMINGFRGVFGDGLIPMIRNMKAAKIAADEARAAGTALDLELSLTALQRADMFGDFGRAQSGFERTMQGISNSFAPISLMDQWNTFMKRFTGVVSQNRTIRDAQDLAAGKTISRSARERLAFLGIDKRMAGRIAEQFRAHGENMDGVRMANTRLWTDAGAVQAFRNALGKEIDMTIVTPGMELPHAFRTPVGGALFQFKSFIASSQARTLVYGLQQRDARFLQSAIMAVGLGMLVYAIRNTLEGRELSDDPEKWIVEGIDRSGLTGWLFEANNMLEKVTRGTMGINAAIGAEPMSRYASRDLIGTFLGPSVGKIESLGVVSGAVFADDWKDSDTRRLRRLLPYNNVFYLRGLFDAGEQGFNEATGTEQTQ